MPGAPAGVHDEVHAAKSVPGPTPRWFTPLRLLGIFCTTNLFVYLDRGLIASNGVNGAPPSDAQPQGSGIQGDFSLTYFQDGLLPAAFMVGLLLSSPVFAEASKTRNPFRLLALGMGIWTLACLGCAASPNFTLMLICRAMVGVGEASFVALAAPFIDDYAPPKSKSKWFAAFYLCVPVGFALGYIVGGVVASAVSWRWAFVLEAACMVPFVAFAALSQPLRMRGSDEHGAGPKGMAAVARAFWLDVKRVVSLKVWLFINMGFTLYVAVLGVYAYWGPKAGRQLFFSTDDKSSSGQADLAFGGVTVLTGVLGTLAGGALLDKLGATLRNGNLICCGSCVFGLVFALITFNATHSFAAFLSLFAITELLLFCLQAPVAAIGMWCVPASLRPLGISLMTACIHLFGDVPSPPLLGAIQSALSEGMSPQDAAQQWRVSMSLISLLLAFGGALFGWAAYISTPAADFRLAGPGTEGNSGSLGGGRRGVGSVGGVGGVDGEDLEDSRAGLLGSCARSGSMDGDGDGEREGVVLSGTGQGRWEGDVGGLGRALAVGEGHGENADRVGWRDDVGGVGKALAVSERRGEVGERGGWGVDEGGLSTDGLPGHRTHIAGPEEETGEGGVEGLGFATDKRGGSDGVPGRSGHLAVLPAQEGGVEGLGTGMVTDGAVGRS